MFLFLENKPPWFLKTVIAVASLDFLQTFAVIIDWIGVSRRTKSFQDFL